MYYLLCLLNVTMYPFFPCFCEWLAVLCVLLSFVSCWLNHVILNLLMFVQACRGLKRICYRNSFAHVLLVLTCFGRLHLKMNFNILIAAVTLWTLKISTLPQIDREILFGHLTLWVKEIVDVATSWLNDVINETRSGEPKNEVMTLLRHDVATSKFVRPIIMRPQ